MYDLALKNWHWGRLFSKHFGFPLPMLHACLSSGINTKGSYKVRVPKPHLTPKTSSVHKLILVILVSNALTIQDVSKIHNITLGISSSHVDNKNSVTCPSD
jgi:hypothetical protein